MVKFTDDEIAEVFDQTTENPERPYSHPWRDDPDHIRLTLEEKRRALRAWRAANPEEAKAQGRRNTKAWHARNVAAGCCYNCGPKAQRTTKKDGALATVCRPCLDRANARSGSNSRKSWKV